MTPVSASASPGAPPPPRTFPPKKEKYSLVDIILSFLREKPKDAIKGSGYLAFWANFAAVKANKSIPEGVNRYSFAAGDIKNAISTVEIPEKAHTLWQSFKGFWKVVNDTTAGKIDLATGKKMTWSNVASAVRKPFKDMTTLIGNVSDGIDFSIRYIPSLLTKEAMRVIKGVSFAAVLGGNAVGAGEQIYAINKHKDDSKRVTLYLINLARDVSYVALGAIGLGFVLTATPIVPWMILACLTSGLTFSVSGFFYERIVDPEGEGKNRIPANVAYNTLQMRKGLIPATPIA